MERSLAVLYRLLRSVNIILFCGSKKTQELVYVTENESVLNKKVDYELRN